MVVLVTFALGCFLNVAPALAKPVLAPVPGSPFKTGVAPSAVAFGPSGGLLATANFDGGSVSVFSVGSGGVLARVSGSPFSVGDDPGSVAFSPSGGLLANSNAEDFGGSVSVFSVGSGGVLAAVPGSPFRTSDGAGSVAFSPSGGLLATANEGVDGGSVSVFSVGSGGVLAPVSVSQLKTGANPVSVAFSPSGELLATANSIGGSVSVFSVGSGGALTPVPGSPFSVGDNPNSVAFSPSGGLLATASSDDGSVSVFSVGSGGVLARVPGSPFQVGDAPNSVAFSPSGGLLATANNDDSVSVFAVNASDASGSSGSGVPVSSSAPRLSGRASVGRTLSCLSGRWSRTPSKVTYKWVVEGRAIPGATTKLIRVRSVEEGLRIACVTTPYAGSAAGKPVTSRSVYVGVPVVSGCPAASRTLGSLLRLLGLRRGSVGALLAASSDSGQTFDDDFCLTPTGLLVGYPPASLLGSLPGGTRSRFAGRVVWVSTANRFYSIAGVASGVSLTSAKRLLKLSGPYTVGGETWYLARQGRYVVVLIVRDGVVSELGVSDWPLGTTTTAAGKLVSGLSRISQESVRVSGPLRALDDYWSAIGEHAFLHATGYVRPGVIGSVSGFVSSERAEGVRSAQFEGRLLSESGSRARVRIARLVTYDHQFGCRTWSGVYTLAYQSGRWEISQAAIKPRSCT